MEFFPLSVFEKQSLPQRFLGLPRKLIFSQIINYKGKPQIIKTIEALNWTEILHKLISEKQCL